MVERTHTRATKCAPSVERRSVRIVAGLRADAVSIGAAVEFGA